MRKKVDVKRATRVLVVEDMDSYRLIIKKYLKKMGFSDITGTNDGSKAYEKILESCDEGNPFDIILTDWNMPGLEGPDLIEKVRQLETYKYTPIIMITTLESKENIEEVKKVGANDYLIKPFEFEEFKGKINGLIKD